MVSSTHTHTHYRLGAQQSGRPGNLRFWIPHNKHPLSLWCPSHTHTLGWAPGSLGVPETLALGFHITPPFPLLLWSSHTHTWLTPGSLDVRETLALGHHIISTPFLYGVHHTHTAGRPGGLGVRETLALGRHMINTPCLYGVHHTHTRLGARESGRPGNPCFGIPYTKHPLPPWCPSHTHHSAGRPGA